MNRFKLSLFAASALCVGGLVATVMPASARDSDVSFSITLGDAEIGYSDGYYDQQRRWHSWSNDDERDWYQQNYRQSYYEMDREDDRDQYRRDWREGRRQNWRGDSRDGSDANFSISLGNVVFGYSDGYYDQNRRWHGWQNDNEREWYRRNRTHTYYHMGRYQDRDRYRRDWRDGRRTDWRGDRYGSNFAIVLGNVVFGYSDGYYDNDRRWHSWRSTDERSWYRQNHGRTYYNMRRNRDQHRIRRDWREGRRQDWRDDRDRN